MVLRRDIQHQFFSQIQDYYLDNKSLKYALFLDTSKAFDRVHHSKLFKNLKDKGVCPLYIRLILTNL